MRHRAEFWLAAALLCLAGGWLVLHTMSAPALWRDEVSSVNTYMSATTEEMWQRAEFESFPALWMFLLRGWLTVAGDGDIGLRLFGATATLLMLLSVWFAGTRLAGREPALALALLVCNPEVMRWSTTLRPWGLGAGLAVAVLPLLWQASMTPTVTRVAMATGAAILSVHCVFQNAVLLGAGIAACCVVSLRRREYRCALVAVGVGVTAALTLVPYLGVIHRRSAWNDLGSAGIGFEDLLSVFLRVIQSAGIVPAIVWALVAGWVAWSAVKAWSSGQDVTLFSATATAAAAAGLGLLYLQLDYPTQAWYYLGLIAVAATCCDVAIRRPPWPLIAAVVVVFTGFWPTFSDARVPYTNLAGVAAHLDRSARAGDLILVNPWFLGFPLTRYYSGPAALESVPPLADHTIARYDLLKQQMQMSDPVAPLRARIRETLLAGNTVWFAGLYELPPAGVSMNDLHLPPPPLPERGWASAPYETLWAFQISLFLQTHARSAVTVPTDPGGPLESAELRSFTGWRGEGPKR